jgi:hypothetical protein
MQHPIKPKNTNSTYMKDDKTCTDNNSLTRRAFVRMTALASAAIGSVPLANWSGFTAPATSSADESRWTRLWYDKPAANWNEALPLGNGRLGAMVFGGTGRERLQLNEETIWTGEPDKEDYYHCDGPKALPEIRRLTFADKWSEAQDLFQKSMVERNWAKYQPMFDLWIETLGHETVQEYRRELSLDDAVATTTYKEIGRASCRERVYRAV